MVRVAGTGFYIKVVYLGRPIEGQFKNTRVVVINGMIKLGYLAISLK